MYKNDGMFLHHTKYGKLWYDEIFQYNYECENIKMDEEYKCIHFNVNRMDLLENIENIENTKCGKISIKYVLNCTYKYVNYGNILHACVKCLCLKKKYVNMIYLMYILVYKYNINTRVIDANNHTVLDLLEIYADKQNMKTHFYYRLIKKIIKRQLLDIQEKIIFNFLTRKKMKLNKIRLNESILLAPKSQIEMYVFNDFPGGQWYLETENNFKKLMLQYNKPCLNVYVDDH